MSDWGPMVLATGQLLERRRALEIARDVLRDHHDDPERRREALDEINRVLNLPTTGTGQCPMK